MNARLFPALSVPAGHNWLEAPPKPHDFAAWSFHKLPDAGWIMSLTPREFPPRSISLLGIAPER